MPLLTVAMLRGIGVCGLKKSSSSYFLVTGLVCFRLFSLRGSRNPDIWGMGNVADEAYVAFMGLSCESCHGVKGMRLVRSYYYVTI